MVNARRTGGMASIDREWQIKAAGLIKAEMARKNLSYRDLQARLAAMKIDDNEKNLSTKISRGRFTAAFLLQVMQAMGARVIRLADDD